MIWIRLFTGLWLLFTLAAGAHGADWVITVPPNWVQQQAFDTPARIPENEIVDGIYYLLIERQTRITPGNVQYYYHVAKMILNTEGAEQASQLNIAFDPSYQALQLHTVRVHKADRAIDQLDSGRITLLQREDELERQLYNGQKSAHLILEGTGAGDVIEYAYTITGQNPVFGDKFVHQADLSWDAAVERLYDRYLFTGTAALRHNQHNTDWHPDVRQSPDGVEYLYDHRQVAAVISDGHLPVWYTPYAWLEFSQFRDWAEVAAWGSALYRLPQTISRELQQRIDTLAKPAILDTERVAAALCAVQREIRYLGMEIGPGSYQPSDPSLIYRRKFGDCKDKALLFCTLLDRLGIQAYPALVNTYRQSKSDTLLPSPLAFNHVIVKVVCDGKAYWVDPTGDCQQTGLENHYPAAYGKALVLSLDTRDLQSITEPLPSVPRKEIQEIFDLTDGIGQPARLDITTVFQGREADRMRYDLKSSGIQKAAKSYLNYYAADYPSVAARKPLAIDDDAKANRLTIREFYDIPELWQTAEGGRTSAAFYARDFESLFQKPRTTLRTMPLGVDHPVHVLHHTVVRLPESWPVAPEHFVLENDAFDFTYDLANADTVLQLTYRYRTKADFVPADKTSRHMADLEQINDKIGYVIYTKALGAQTSWTGVGAWVLGGLLALGLGFAFSRYDPAPAPSLAESMVDPALKGIGGWLILVMLGLISRPIVLIKMLVELRGYLQQSRWDLLADVFLHDRLLLGKVLVAAEITINTLFLGLCPVLLVLFFKKRSSFPKLFIFWLLSYNAAAIADRVLTGLVLPPGQATNPKEIAELIRNAVSSIIWLMYMIKSVRVRQTFTVRRRPPLPTAAPGPGPDEVVAGRS